MSNLHFLFKIIEGIYYRSLTVNNKNVEKSQVRVKRQMDQEKLKSLLRNFIQETENDNITTTEQLINLVVNELEKSLLVASNR